MDVPSETWLSAHVFYVPPWEEILVRAIHTFVEFVLGQQSATQFFFVRYWERGHHLRLRFKGNRRVLETVVKPGLGKTLNSYLERKPSQRSEPESTAEVLMRADWYPNNSIQYVKYEPEIERYGGPAGVLIAEKQFHASSRTVLSILSTGDDWDYGRVLGSAIQMHLALAFSFDMSAIEAAQFFSYVLRCWLPSVLVNPIASQEELERQRNETLKAFELKFLEQSSALIPFHRTLWRALEDKVGFEQDWLTYWLDQSMSINSDLRRAHESGELSLSKPVVPHPSTAVPHETQSLWPILESYVHMTNNRLGVSNLDEAYLGYLISKSLMNLSTGNTNEYEVNETSHLG